MGKYHVHRADANAEELYEHLESLGASVARLGRPTDAVVGYAGVSCLVEIKAPRGELEPSQRRLLKGWKGTVAVLRAKPQCDLLLKYLADRDFAAIHHHLVLPEVR